MKRVRTRVGLVAAMGAVMVLAGCATAGGGTAGGGDATDQSFGSVVVENDSPLTVNVYAIRHSGRFRLGTVTGLRQETFELRRHMLDTGTYLQLLIEPLGGQHEYYTDRIYVAEGESVRIQVSNFIR